MTGPNGCTVNWPDGWVCTRPEHPKTEPCAAVFIGGEPAEGTDPGYYDHVYGPTGGGEVPTPASPGMDRETREWLTVGAFITGGAALVLSVTAVALGVLCR